MSVRHFWRRFRPGKREQGTAPAMHEDSVFARAEAKVDQLFPNGNVAHEEVLSTMASIRQEANTKDDAALWIAALILQAPRAAAAQQEMDKHPHGYQNK